MTAFWPACKISKVAFFKGYSIFHALYFLATGQCLWPWRNMKWEDLEREVSEPQSILHAPNSVQDWVHLYHIVFIFCQWEPVLCFVTLPNSAKLQSKEILPQNFLQSRKWERQAGKSFSLLPLVVSLLPPKTTFPTQTSLLAVGQVLLFEDGKMGEEMVKFKAKKDSGKKHCRKCDFFIEQNVQTAAANVATFGDNWPFKEVSTDFRPALLV